MVATKRYYLGLACTMHDPAVAIVGPDGEVVFAEATERHLQTKRAYYQPPDDIMWIGDLLARYVPRDAELVVAHSWEERRWKSVLARAAYALVEKRISPLLLPTIIGQTNAYDIVGRSLQYRLAEAGDTRRVTRRYYDHHLVHAAAVCYATPFEEAACAVIDAHGEKSPHSFFRWRAGRIEPIKVARRRDFRKNASLGLFYSGLCMACGFDPVKGEEWKVMGLAPYGKRDDRIYARLRRLLRVDGLDLFGDNIAIVDELRAMRTPGRRAIENADLAHTGQVVFAEVATELLANLHRLEPSKNLALSGGCALNSSFNGKIVGATGFERLFVNSAPADDGNALGAALLAYHEDHPRAPARARVQSPYLGDRMRPESIEAAMRLGGLRDVLPAGVPIHRACAELLAGGKILGWVQGRAEFGPRALGNRSILADPRRADVKESLNARVKFREEFRPFAPSILHEHGDEYFEHYQESPYMERALAFRADAAAKVPGVVHVDRTGRLQTVRREYNERFYELIAAFHALTGVPIVLNTSFNVMGKPIIHSVEDALAVFHTSGLDALALGDHLFVKNAGDV